MMVEEQVDQDELLILEESVISDEIDLRQERLAKLAKAKAVLEEQAKERFAAEQAEYQAKLQEGEEKNAKTNTSHAVVNRNRPNRVLRISINSTSLTRSRVL